MVSESIINRCKDNERNAQGLLYKSCAPYIYTVVKGYVSDTEFFKDTMQEAFASIFKSIQNYNSELGSFKSWIAQITTRKCIDHLRKSNKLGFNTTLEVVELHSNADFKHLDELSKNDIERMLEKMPVGYKTIFILYVLDEYPHKEIASMLDISPETSRSQLHRAMGWIKKNIFQTSNQSRYEAF